MKLRIARKILRDPSQYTCYQVIVAARRARPFWFHDGQTPPMLRQEALWNSWGDPCRAMVSRARRCQARDRGLHDWAWRQVDLPF